MRLSHHDLSSRTKSVQNKRWLRKIRTYQKAKYRRAGYNWAGFDRIMTIKSPFALNISSKNNRRYTLKFFNDIRTLLIVQNTPIQLDLRKLQFLTPVAALLLIAEFDRAKRIMGKDFRVSLIRSETHRINAVLDQIGFSALCNSKLSDEKEDEADDELVRHWRYATGERINDQTTKAVMEIQGRIATTLHKGMWVGISEAIGNACLHAYLDSRNTDGRDLETKRWWMLSIEKDGILSVTVADLGIGIPRSLPLKWPRGTLSKVYDKLVGGGDDERAIRAAMEVGATSTSKSHRGNGLPQIWHDLRSDQRSQISIYSNKGVLSWSGVTKLETSSEYKDSIYGTVISWSFPARKTRDDQSIEN